MIQRKPFLVAIGSSLCEGPLRFASNRLSTYWGGNLIKHYCEEDPSTVLKSLPNEPGMVQLTGDPAMHYQDQGSWFEALGAWRQPTVLFAKPLDSGKIPGIVHAYAALCKTSSVPLLGLLQLGGYWEPSVRRKDGLPWCGWVSDGNNEEESFNSSQNLFEVHPEIIVLELQRRIKAV